MFFPRSALAMFVALFSLASLASTPSCEERNPVSDARENSPKSAEVSIDGERALQYIKEIILFGPRHAGTPGAEKTRQYIIDKLSSFGLMPKRYDFTAFTPHPDLKQVKMANITADIGATGEKKVLIGGHFEGKLIPGISFQGANDGGSSTALLLELGRVLALQKPTVPVRLAFFDGEEALVEWSDSDSLYGSKHMAAELKEKGEETSIAAVVIVDMIGDARLKINWDTTSTPRLLRALVRTAKKLGISPIFSASRSRIEDDHLPFLRIGIPACVLIDLNYGPGWTSNAYWHSDSDTIDKLSATSIEQVGNIILQSLAELASP